MPFIKSSKRCHSTLHHSCGANRLEPRAQAHVRRKGQVWNPLAIWTAVCNVAGVVGGWWVGGVNAFWKKYFTTVVVPEPWIPVVRPVGIMMLNILASKSFVKKTNSKRQVGHISRPPMFPTSYDPPIKTCISLWFPIENALKTPIKSDFGLKNSTAAAQQGKRK